MKKCVKTAHSQIEQAKNIKKLDNKVDVLNNGIKRLLGT